MSDKPSILLIDSNPDTRSLCLHIAQQDYEVRRADSFEEASDLAKNLTLELSGVVVHVTNKIWLNFIQQHRHNFPLLALSPIATHRAQGILRKAGAHVILPAPFTGLQLNRALKKLKRLEEVGLMQPAENDCAPHVA